jgi:hypothetical protein
MSTIDSFRLSVRYMTLAFTEGVFVTPPGGGPERTAACGEREEN